ncbi:TMEM165/GDT1 family protein [Halapricum hydrolyticum]|uniref:TMEM165/GDT1 family protein n=1 Tax=Halapricum hydrolyticum TaxID=2979991 RepID=A0AAE3IAG7_9EURY|nr:TMEM165/GDT1 family protein [Halapricum hydrolyticum]MCU4718366.1 TMEM165/GDT1 family protein [Halapricum hydrolyticum]MCU4726521.1 TMEM165/GDT1 family protein [Halapricum hydrolyticum]
MSDFLIVVFVAATAQLAVLPGEKVQFIIAGLSTRYHPLIVVSAAGAAFAGWTALEILFGNALQGALPELYLNLFTAILFAVFAVLLLRSAPAKQTHPTATDGGAFGAEGNLDVEIFGREVPNALGGWLPIFAMMSAGEFGDKTQLITITLAAQYGAHPGIWIGEMLAIIPVSLANAYFFHTFSHRFDIRKAHFVGAAIFAFFAADTVLAITTGFSVWETVVNAVGSTLLDLLTTVGI